MSWTGGLVVEGEETKFGHASRHHRYGLTIRTEFVSVISEFAASSKWFRPYLSFLNVVKWGLSRGPQYSLVKDFYMDDWRLCYISRGPRRLLQRLTVENPLPCGHICRYTYPRGQHNTSITLTIFPSDDYLADLRFSRG